jgi:MFS family permease
MTFSRTAITETATEYAQKFWGFVGTTFRSVRHRNYRLFFMGQSVSLIGTWLQNTALSWLVYSITQDSRALGIMSFLGSVPVLLIGIYAGTIADEYPKRKIIMITQSLAGLFALVMALVVWQGWTTIWILGAINFLLGITIAFDLPTRQAFVVEMVGKEDVANAVALNSSVFNAARLVGPAIAAMLIANVSIEVCFLLNGLSFIAVIISLSRMRIPNEERKARKQHASRLHAMKEGVHYLYKIPNYRALMTLVVAMTLFAWSYTVNLPAIAVKVLHGSEGTYASLLSANGLGALLAALSQAAFGPRMRPRSMLYISIATFVVAVSIIPFVTIQIGVMALLVVAGWSIITFFITANSTLQRYVPDELRGRVMGIYSLSFTGLYPFGSLLTGFLGHEFGVGPALWVDAGIMALVTIPTYFWARTLPRLSEIAERSGSPSIYPAAVFTRK